MKRERPHLIILPSPLIMGRTYLKLGNELNNAFQVLIPDLPGTGTKSGSWKRWSEEDYAEWVIKFMDSLHMKKAYLLGHSNSGPIAARIALEHPERVHGLILADTVGVIGQNYFRMLWARSIDLLLELRFTFKAGVHLFINLFSHSTNFFRQVRLAVITNLPKGMNELKVPLFILWGKKDHTTPLLLGKSLNSKVPSSKFYVSENGSHD